MSPGVVADSTGVVTVLVDTFKGGVGKTTTSVGLARGLAAYGPTVLVGTSPQNDILDGLSAVPDIRKGLREHLKGGPMPDQFPIADNLRLVPAGYSVPEVRDLVALGAAMRRLWEALDAQFIVVDGFNFADAVAFGALFGSDALVVPTTIYPEATRAVLRVFRHLKERVSPELRPAVVRALLTQVPSASRRNKTETALYETIASTWSRQLFSTQIRRSGRYGITELPTVDNPSVRGSLTMTSGTLAEDYGQLCRELLTLLAARGLVDNTLLGGQEAEDGAAADGHDTHLTDTSRETAA